MITLLLIGMPLLFLLLVYNNYNLKDRIYELFLICDDNYPLQPPKIRFVSKINAPFINQSNGWVNINKMKVDNSKIVPLKAWNKINTIQDALTGIRKEMETPSFKKLSQPSEGSTFS